MQVFGGNAYNEFELAIKVLGFYILIFYLPAYYELIIVMQVLYIYIHKLPYLL